MNPPKISTREEWRSARKQLLAAEKAHTRAYDELMRRRRDLPWVPVDEEYVFDAPGGQRTLADLFDGRSQLLVYHFMLGPGWDRPCEGCSFICDHVDAARRHFEQADLSFVAVSRATIDAIEAVRHRMGWEFPWVSSSGNRFNFDYHVSFTREQIESGQAEYNFAPYHGESEDLHGCSVFAKAGDGRIYHTYSCYARGAEKTLGAFMFLDMTPKGRNEADGTMSWVRLHDEYDSAGRGSPATTEPDSSCGCSGPVSNHSS